MDNNKDDFPSFELPRARGKAEEETHFDPVLEQQRKEQRAEEARREKIRLRNAEIPEYMIDRMGDTDANLIDKGGVVDLMAKVPSLRNLLVGVGWDQKVMEENDTDIDLSIFLLDRNDMTRQDQDFIFYNQMTAYDGAVRHAGDNRTGAGDGDDEGAFIDLNGLPFEIAKIMFVLSIYDEADDGVRFDRVKNIFFRLVNKDYNEEIVRFMLPDGDYDGQKAVFVASLVREGPKWYLNALGEGLKEGNLAQIAARYGIIVRELQSTG